MLDYDYVETRDVNCPICSRINDLGSSITVKVKDYLNVNSGQEFIYLLCFCGVYYLVNQPHADQLKKIYSQGYEAYTIADGLVSKLKRKRLKSVVKPQLVFGRKTRILDYGCGSGEFVYSAGELVDTTVVGYDFNPPNHSKVSNVFFVNSEAEIRRNGDFDLIFSFQLIEHLPDPGKFLDFLRDLLSDGGRVVLETPSSSGILFHRLVRVNWGGWHAPRHFVIFDKESITQLCSKKGFAIEEFRYLPSPFQWNESIRPYLPRGSRLNKLLSLDNFFLVSLFYLIDIILIFFGAKSSNMKLVLTKV